jgi:hypothetical protein
MIPVANDPLSLEHSSPLDVAAFLRVRGWRSTESWGDKCSLSLHRAGNVVYDLPLPSRRDFADYALRLHQISKRLSQVNSRDANQILRELESTAHELLRVRAVGVEA